jgi:hypothetical protein
MGEPCILAGKQLATQSFGLDPLSAGVRAAGMYGTIDLFF